MNKGYFLVRRAKLRETEKKKLAKLRRILSCLTNAIVRDDREKISKWQRLLLKYYDIVNGENNKLIERR